MTADQKGGKAAVFTIAANEQVGERILEDAETALQRQACQQRAGSLVLTSQRCPVDAACRRCADCREIIQSFQKACSN